MTSSLVGSEMCIRDRSQPVSHAPRRRHRLVLHVPSQGLHADGGRVRAVSYTHLTLPTICSV
eukprot:11805122-Prorocentrum_lima.AAC.1